MVKYSDEDIIEYIEHTNNAADIWIKEFAKNPKMQQSYFWPLFTSLFVHQKREIPVNISDAARMIPQLSPSQARRVMAHAEQAGYLEIKKPKPGSKATYVRVTAKTEDLIRRTCKAALSGMAQIFRS
ncbi:MAG: hypothetical protein ACE5KF_02680 [Kiloniellaceae bacterium]